MGSLFVGFLVDPGKMCDLKAKWQEFFGEVGEKEKVQKVELKNTIGSMLLGKSA